MPITPGLYGWVGGNANVASTNTIGLYGLSSNTSILSSATVLLGLLSQNGNVKFALDPVTSNTKVLAYTANIGTVSGTYGNLDYFPVITVTGDGRVTNVSTISVASATGGYGNANVAAYLPTYTGSLENSSSIISLWSNAATQQSQIIVLTSNAASQAVDINNLWGNAASQQVSINSLTSNAATQAGEINNLWANAATQAGEINNLWANAATQSNQITSISSNLNSFEAYANATFGTSSYSNVDVAAYLVTNTGNVNAGYFTGNGAFLTGLPATYGNTQANAWIANQYGLFYDQFGVTRFTGGNTLGPGRAITITPAFGLTLGGASSKNNYIQGKFVLDSSYGRFYLDGYPGGNEAVQTQIQANSGANIGLSTGANITANSGAYINLRTGSGIVGNGTAIFANVSSVNGFFWSNGTPYGTATTYGNTDVAAYLPTYTGNIGGNVLGYQPYITTLNNITTGNIKSTNGYFWANGTPYATASTYGNTEVAAYLPTYTGSLEQSSSIVNLWSNAASQQTQIDGLTSNAASQAVDINNLWTNAATQASSINSLQSNAASQQTQIDTLTSNAATQAAQINAISGNLNAFETYANATFGTSNYSNVNVAAYLPTYTGTFGTLSNLTSAGNVTVNTGGYFVGDGLYITNVDADTAQTIRISVKNTSSQTLPKGTPVYSTGQVGVTDVYEVSPSWANTAATMPAVGLLDQSLAINATGYATQIGLLSSVDTSTYTANQVLYVGIGGGLTTTRPNDSYQVQPVGSVGRVNATTGSIFVNIWNTLQVPNLGQGNVWVGPTGGGLPVEQAMYGNTQVAAYLPTYTGALENSSSIVNLWSNAATQAGQISAISGNLNAFETYANATFGTSSYGNANVAAYLPTYSGNIGGTITTASQPYITSVGTLTSLTATGNITTTTGYFVGDGSYLTNLPSGGGYGNTQVAAYLPTYTGNLAASNFTANVNYNNTYITSAILSTTREKSANIGVIQGTVTVDASTGPIQLATVTANITINTNNITNLGVGQTITLVLTQNTNANSRILTSNIKYAGGYKTLSTANAAIDTITITYDGEKYLGSLVKGYA